MTLSAADFKRYVCCSCFRALACSVASVQLPRLCALNRCMDIERLLQHPGSPEDVTWYPAGCKQTIRIASPAVCSLCNRVELKPESTGLSVQWRVDLTRLQWTIKHVTPACLHCCTASSADALLNAALSVSDAAGKATIQGVSEHVLAANGHPAHKGELVQAALNLGHSIKILAGNLPCRVVRGGAPLPASDVPALCIELLQAGAGGPGMKTPTKIPSRAKDGKKSGASDKRKRAAVAEEPSGSEEQEAGGSAEDRDGGEPAGSKSSKKNRSAGSKTPDAAASLSERRKSQALAAPATPASRSAKAQRKAREAPAMAGEADGSGSARKTKKTPGKKTPAKTPRGA